MTAEFGEPTGTFGEPTGCEPPPAIGSARSGFSLPRDETATGSAMTVHLVSDTGSFMAGGGFTANFTCPVRPTCGGTLRLSETSPGITRSNSQPGMAPGQVGNVNGTLDFDGAYGANAECDWILSCSEGSPVINFTSFGGDPYFETEDCLTDGVHVYDGESTSAPPLGRQI